MRPFTLKSSPKAALAILIRAEVIGDIISNLSAISSNSTSPCDTSSVIYREWIDVGLIALSDDSEYLKKLSKGSLPRKPPASYNIYLSSTKSIKDNHFFLV